MGKSVSISGYRLVNLLMTGQTSQVWQVVHEASFQHFALKLLLPETVREPEHRKFLQHEADVGLNLRHPNVVKTHRYINDKKNPHFVMEFFPSINMKLRLVYKDNIYNNHVLDVLLGLGEGLRYMHDKDYVHKDVKLDNVLVNGDAKVKLIDFALAQQVKKGLAKLFGGRGPVVGTRSYMSPEQIKGEHLDPRSDIYAYGVCTFELLTGRLPYVANDPNELLRKHVHARVESPLSYNEDVSIEMEQLVMSMLAKKPDDRPQSMGAVVSKLRQINLFSRGERK